MRGIAAALLVLLVSVAGGVTIYVDAQNGSDTGGDGSQGSPYASMSKIFSVVAGGDTVLIQPGSYGSVTFGKNKGNGTDSTGWITYLADPSVCTPRPDSWYEDSIPRPDVNDPQGQVIFSGVKFEVYADDFNATDKSGTPNGHYIVLEGINIVNGNLLLQSYVANVVVRNCNVFGKWSDYSTQITGYAVNMYRAVYYGSNYRDILIEGCYGTRTTGGAIFLGDFTNVTVRNCHFHRFASTGISMNGGARENVLVEGNHVHEQITRADYIKSRHVAVSVDAAEPDRIVILNSGGSYWDYATVTDATTDSTELRVVASFDTDSLKLVLAEPLSFDMEPGDSVRLWDGTHGSGVSVRSDNFTLRGNRIHSCGASRGLYFYDRPYHDVILENNLFYSTLNYTVDLHSYMDDGCRVINNTFVGTRHSNYYTNNDGDMAYGHAMIGAAPASGADATSLVVANNVFVGIATAPAGGIVKNNIVFAGSGFEEDSEGDNSGNLVYYDGEAAGSEPSPFHQAAGFFVGGDGFDEGYLARHLENFNAYFALAEGSDAIGFADPAYATDTDMTGVSRDGAPDAGCYEWVSTGIPGPDVTKNITGVTVAPNPMVSTLDIVIETSRRDVSAMRVDIYDQSGNTVWLRTVGAIHELPLRWDGTGISGSPAAPGMYFYRVTVGDEEYSGKIFKIK